MAVALVQSVVASSGAASTAMPAMTLTNPPAVGAKLVFTMGGDKNTGTTATWAAANNWTINFELLSTSVSLYLLTKTSDGSEQSITPSWATASAVGNMAFYGEYDDSAVSGSSWQVSGSASHITDEVATTSWATGTTGATSAAGLGIAVAAVDSSQNVTVPVWSNSYTNRYDGTGGAGRGAIFVAEHAEAASATASSTFSYTLGTVDQISAAIAVFTKVAAGGAAAAPLIVNSSGVRLA